MGKTNPTKQFNMLKKRAKILNIHHGWDIVVMACHSHGRGTSFATFGTAGLGQDFIGETKSRSVTGKAVVDLFSSFANQNSCKKLLAQTDGQEINLKATKPSTEMLSDPPSTSTNQPSTSTNQPSTSTNQPSTSNQPSTVHPPINHVQSPFHYLHPSIHRLHLLINLLQLPIHHLAPLFYWITEQLLE